MSIFCSRGTPPREVPRENPLSQPTLSLLPPQKGLCRKLSVSCYEQAGSGVSLSPLSLFLCQLSLFLCQLSASISQVDFPDRRESMVAVLFSIRNKRAFPCWFRSVIQVRFLSWAERVVAAAPPIAGPLEPRPCTRRRGKTPPPPSNVDSCVSHPRTCLHNPEPST